MSEQSNYGMRLTGTVEEVDGVKIVRNAMVDSVSLVDADMEKIAHSIFGPLDAAPGSITEAHLKEKIAALGINPEILNKPFNAPPEFSLSYNFMSQQENLRPKFPRGELPFMVILDDFGFFRDPKVVPKIFDYELIGGL